MCDYRTTDGCVKLTVNSNEKDRSNIYKFVYWSFKEKTFQKQSQM